MRNFFFPICRISCSLLAFIAFVSMYSCKDTTPSKTEPESTSYQSDAVQDSEIAKAVLSNEDASKSELINKIDKSSGNVAAQILMYKESGFPDGKVFNFKNVDFPTGSADVSEDLQREVEELAVLLQVYPELKIKIESHTDNIGDEALNQMLSDLRANNIKDLLSSQFGIAAERIDIAGLGQSRPLMDNETEEGKLKNRRILLYLVK